MPRVFKITILAGCCIAGLFFVLLFTHRLRPSELYIHIDSIPWSCVTVESDNLSKPQSFDHSAHELRLSPISHGVYRIGVELSDGQFIWSQFLHYDAGVRRRIDIFLTPSQNSGYIHIRETTNRRKQLFEGDSRAADTSKEKPITLDWI